jgi:hypothetical protein
MPQFVTGGRLGAAETLAVVAVVAAAATSTAAAAMAARMNFNGNSWSVSCG